MEGAKGRAVAVVDHSITESNGMPLMGHTAAESTLLPALISTAGIQDAEGLTFVCMPHKAQHLLWHT